MARPSPRPSVPSRAARPSQQPRRDLTPNRDVNRNINRDVNIDRDWDVDNGWGYNGCCHVDHPIAATAAVVGAAAVGASLGSTVYTLPPSCTTVVVDGIAYNDCNGVYYQPQFVGTTTQYVVVSKP